MQQYVQVLAADVAEQKRLQPPPTMGQVRAEVREAVGQLPRAYLGAGGNPNFVRRAPQGDCSFSFLFLAHLARAARRALALRCSGVKFSALFFPLLEPALSRLPLR